MAALSFRQSPVVNNYTCMVLSAYLRASGRKVTKHELAYTDTMYTEAYEFV